MNALVQQTNNTDNNSNVPATRGQYIQDLMNDKQFDSLNKQIAKSSNSARELVEAAAMQALLIASIPEKANFEWATSLIHNVETNLSPFAALQLRAWFTTFGPFKYTNTKNGKVMRKSKSENAPAFDIQGAYENPWFSFARDRVGSLENTLYNVDTFETRIERTISQIQRAIDSQIKAEKDNKESVFENPNIDVPVLMHVRDALKNVLVNADKERDKLLVRLEDKAAKVA